MSSQTVEIPKIEFPAKLSPLFEPHPYKVMPGGRGSSKCLGRGTPVLMFDGTIRPVEDVAVGDQVMGPDSFPRNVLSTTTGVSELYRVNQTSAMSYVVNEDHILSLKKSKSCRLDMGPVLASGRRKRERGRYPDYADVVNISVKDYLVKSERWQQNFRGYRAGLIKFPNQPAPLDPYLLGVWLGDGLHRELMITSADEEIVEYLQAYCGQHQLSFSKGGKKGNRASDYRLGRGIGVHGRTNPTWAHFKSLNVVSNKHIPQSYLTNDEPTRLSLLAGLLDSDGHMVRNGYCIVQTNKRIADGVKMLADSLGFRTSINWRSTICGNNGVRGEAWAVAINGDTWRIPCLVKRKQVNKDDYHPNKDKMLSYVSVEPIGIGEYFGFAVDGDHLFCLGDGTVTHNSWSVGRAFLLIGMKKKERFLCLREKQLSIKESVHQLLCDQIDAMNLRHFYRTTDTSIRGANGTTFSFFGLQSHTVDSVRSVEGATKIWVEEAQNVGKASWKVLIPTVRTEGREFWITFNPLLETGDTYKRFVANPPPGAVVIQMNWRDNPWFPAVLEQERLYAKATMEDEEYQNVWEGQPIRSIPGAIYAAQIAKLYAEDRATIVRYDPRLKVHVVQDLGFGDINAVGFFQRKLSELRCIRAEGYTRLLNHEVAAEIKKLPYNFGAVWLPHDGFAEGRKGDTEEQLYRNFGFIVKRVPDFPVETGIRRAKEVFGQTYFDQQLTEPMLEGLKHYKRSKSNERVGSPVHDAEGNSDWADMFRYAALSCRQFWNESDLQIPTSARPFQQADPFMGVFGG